MIWATMRRLMLRRLARGLALLAQLLVYFATAQDCDSSGAVQFLLGEAGALDHVLELL
jgi:hypothetical protein